jgi:hypothetical protein
VKKLTIFVEGATEVAFVDQLLRQLISARKLCIDHFQGAGGSRTPRRLTRVSAMAQSPEQRYYIQIVDSGTDNRVASDIRDNYDSLVQNGFEAIIGIRDVHPVSRLDLARLRAGLRYNLRTKPITAVFILGVMETEAWFLAEHTHFPKIHANLTVNRIQATLHFDPSADDMQLRDCPHEDLHNIYAMEGLAYRKRGSQIERTVRVLDYERVYFDLVTKFPDIHALIVSLDNFFS